MSTNISEFPKHPHPHVPRPQEPHRPHVQPPTVFVYEKQGWEYKVVSKNAADEPPLTEDELNELGKDGWELVGVVSLTVRVQFYSTLVWYAAFADHYSLFPGGSVLEAFRDEVEGFTTRKGTIQFPIDKPLPVALIKRIVKARVAQVATQKLR